MTPEQQRIAIAEACGWTFPTGYPKELGVPHKEYHARILPDYLNDLNSMNEAEEHVIEPHDIEEYTQQLYMVLERYWTVDRWIKFSRLAIDYAFAHAKAEHRAEAFLRTVGKWITS